MENYLYNLGEDGSWFWGLLEDNPYSSSASRRAQGRYKVAAIKEAMCDIHNAAIAYAKDPLTDEQLEKEAKRAWRRVLERRRKADEKDERRSYWRSR